MVIFLSYASECKLTAEEVSVALLGLGHEVFYDQESLPAGGDFRRRIRDAIDGSDMFIFLVSRESLEPRSFTQTELEIARQKWQHPAQHVLPVIIDDTDIDELPPYLKAVTVLQPKGDIAAAVCSEVENWSPLEEVDRLENARDTITSSIQRDPAVGAVAPLIWIGVQVGRFMGEVAEEGTPNKLYRRELEGVVLADGTTSGDRTRYTASRSSDYIDELGRTCCEVSLSCLRGAEAKSTSGIFYLERGRWKAAN